MEETGISGTSPSPSSIYSSLRSLKSSRGPLGCSFSQRFQLFIGYRRTSISNVGPHSPILTLAYTLDSHSEIVEGPFSRKGPRSLNFFTPRGLKSYFFVLKQLFLYCFIVVFLLLKTFDHFWSF